MPIQGLLDKLIQVGKRYPEQPPTMFERLRGAGKHDNQSAAFQLRRIKNRIDETDEQLQEIQVLIALVKILNLKDFLYSTQLITEIKKELSAYKAYDDLNRHLPKTCSNPECPKISELREAMTRLGVKLHIDYERSKYKAELKSSEDKQNTELKSSEDKQNVENKITAFKELVTKLVKVGESYPEQPSSMYDRLMGAGKHDNQLAAAQLKSIGNKIETRVPEKLQEIQLLVVLEDILSLKDFVYSTKLISDIKKELSVYPTFSTLDRYLPDTCNKDCPKIYELYDAIHQFGKMLHLEHETEKSVAKAEAKLLNEKLITDDEAKTVQGLIDKLAAVGQHYPEQPPSMLQTLIGYGKHDNQAAANSLVSIKTKVNTQLPKKLQELQLLIELVKILTLKDFVNSTQLMTDIKKELSGYEAFDALDKYLPETCANSKCPKISELRDAIHSFGVVLHLEYVTEKSVKEYELEQEKALEKATPTPASM